LSEKQRASSSGTESDWIIHSFIIKIWRDLTPDPSGARWRGRITHVPDAECHYFTSLNEIKGFIATYVENDRPCRWAGKLRNWLFR
jgi:hypothetical protein